MTDRVRPRGRQIASFVSGQTLSADELNAIVREVNANTGVLRSPGGLGPREDEVTSGGERWSFVASSAQTKRFENPDDATLYVDVAERRTITVLTPDGGTVVLELAAAATG